MYPLGHDFSPTSSSSNKDFMRCQGIISRSTAIADGTVGHDSARGWLVWITEQPTVMMMLLGVAMIHVQATLPRNPLESFSTRFSLEQA